MHFVTRNRQINSQRIDGGDGATYYYDVSCSSLEVRLGLTEPKTTGFGILQKLLKYWKQRNLTETEFIHFQRTEIETFIIELKIS